MDKVYYTPQELEQMGDAIDFGIKSATILK